MPSAGGFAFGPYQLDVRARRLIRAGVPIALTDHQCDALHALVSRPGEVLPKDALIQAVWKDVAVDDGSLTQLIFHLRRVLDAADPERFIASARRVGYRFAVPVERVAIRCTGENLDALLAPHRALVDGRAALETLERGQIARARAIFEPLLVSHADDATVHVGFANACVLQFESTRADLVPDVEALRLAEAHARDACRLNPDYGEAWATLGFVLERTGPHVDALAALRRSVALEPDNWRHWLRLSSAAWGEERLRAARRTLELMPECPPAHLLAATVFVGRNALDLAEREVDAGLAAIGRDARDDGSSRFSVGGLHWLKGLLCLARGAEAEALAMFDKELALETRGHMYARELAANTWYAVGAVHLRRGATAAARDAFDETLARVPAHLKARAGLALLEPSPLMDGPRVRGESATDPVPSQPLTDQSRIETPLPALPAPSSVDAAVASAIQHVADDDAAGAAEFVADALAAAPPGNAGWLIPADPLLHVRRDRAVWTRVLALLSTRAA